MKKRKRKKRPKTKTHDSHGMLAAGAPQDNCGWLVMDFFVRSVGDVDPHTREGMDKAETIHNIFKEMIRIRMMVLHSN